MTVTLSRKPQRLGRGLPPTYREEHRLIVARARAERRQGPSSRSVRAADVTDDTSWNAMGVIANVRH